LTPIPLPGTWVDTFGSTVTTIVNFDISYTKQLSYTKQYRVSFDTGGGSTVAGQTVEHGGTATKPDAPTRAGHTFNGWYTDTALTTAFDFNTATITKNTTLYAGWGTNTYTVSFDTGGGSTVANQTVGHGSKATGLPKIQRYMPAGRSKLFTPSLPMMLLLIVVAPLQHIPMQPRKTSLFQKP